MKLKNQARVSRQGDFTNNSNIFIVLFGDAYAPNGTTILRYPKIDSNKVWFNEKISNN